MSHSNTVTSKRTTPGKIRGLRQCENDQGIFTILALDQRGSLKEAINKADPESVPYETIVDLKREFVGTLLPHASAILLDPVFGVPHTTYSGALPGNKGVLVSWEETGYTVKEQARGTAGLEGWSVEKIKRVGASAVKVLLYYHPEASNAREQEAMVAKVGEECAKHDIAFFLEPMSYTIDKNRPKESKEFRRGEVVIETCRRLGPLGVDILKIELPGDPKHDDEAQLLKYSQGVSEVSPLPWVLLSAGQDYADFKRQVEITCRGGASGFLAGRAIWKEAVKLTGAERTKFLRETSTARLKELTEIANKTATPWTKRTSLPAEVPLSWYKSY